MAGYQASGPCIWCHRLMLPGQKLGMFYGRDKAGVQYHGAAWAHRPCKRAADKYWPELPKGPALCEIAVGCGASIVDLGRTVYCPAHESAWRAGANLGIRRR